MISRRLLLSGLAALAAAQPLHALAAGTCASADADGNQDCSVGVVIGDVPLVRQRCENWCWAACIEAVFSLHGREIAQEWAVEKIFGRDSCETASVEQIIQAVNGDWLDQYGLPFRAGAEQLPDAALSVAMTGARPEGSDLAVDTTIALFSNDGAKAIVAELERGYPLIIGAIGAGPVGHAMVLTAARFGRDSTGFVRLVELTVRDPWPDSANRRTLTAEEIGGTFFVARVWVEG